jgi:hypothetical protein
VKPGVLSRPERRGSVDGGRGQLELDVPLFTGATAALGFHAAVDSLLPDAPTGVRETVIHYFDALLGAG